MILSLFWAWLLRSQDTAQRSLQSLDKSILTQRTSSAFMMVHQVEIGKIILFAEEGLLTTVTTLGDMMRIAGNYGTCNSDRSPPWQLACEYQR